MRKLNNRTFFFCGISLVFGVVLSSYTTFFHIFCVISLFLVFALSVLFLLSRGDGLPRLFVLALLIFCFVFGMVLGWVQTYAYQNKYTYQSGEITLEVVAVSDSQFSANNISVDGESVSGGATFSIFFDGEVKVGDVLTFSGYLSPIELFEDGTLHYEYADGIFYRGVGYSLYSQSHVFSVKNYIKNWVFDAQTAMFGENQGIAYAMTFGDSSFVDYTALSLLRRGGIAHIFAVSGLHIGILFSVLKLFSWLKPRSSKKSKAIFNTLVLCVMLFYVYLCDMTASSVRAFLMIACTMTLTHFGLFKDRLNVISAVAFILILYSPYIIFTVGFQLSFLTVVGLVILPPQFSKLLKFIKHKKLNAGIAYASSAFFSTAVVSLFHFGYISTISILLNILLVPIYCVVYVINLAGLAVFAVASITNQAWLLGIVSPFFTTNVFTYSIFLFEKIESVIPLVLYVDISMFVVVVATVIICVFSSLVSRDIKLKTKLAFCGVFSVCVMIVGTLGLFEEKADVSFYYSGNVPLAIVSGEETFLFAKSGSDVDFSKVETEVCHLIVYDYFYKDVTVSGGEEIKINLYATFLYETPDGAYTLSEFTNGGFDVTFVGQNQVSYKGVTFLLGDSEVIVLDAGGEKQMTYYNSYSDYYIIEGEVSEISQKR